MTEKFGGLRCTEVQKAIGGKFWDLRDPQQLEECLQPEIHDKCGSVAGAAARIAAEAILESMDFLGSLKGLMAINNI